MSTSRLDGRNDKRVVLDERLLNCPDSVDGIHVPFRSRDGQRCAECGAWIRESLSRPVIDELAPITPATMDYLRRRLPENLVAMQAARNQVENLIHEQIWQDLGRCCEMCHGRVFHGAQCAACLAAGKVVPAPTDDEDLIRLGSDFQ